MSYTKTNWQDLPNTTTPINASNLNKMEQGIYDAHNIGKYSTSEVEIGTWTNGSKLYRKVYEGTVSNIETICNADSRNFIVNMYGIAVAQNGVRMPMNNSFSNSAYVWAGWWSADMSTAFNFGANFTSSSSVTIIIEYTK